MILLFRPGRFFLIDENMPQGRIILKAISESKKVASLKTDGARLLFTWLIPHVDVNGCFSGDPEVVRGKVFTRLGKTADTIEKYLSELADANLIVRYSANSDDFLCIPDFSDKQPNLQPKKEGKPRIPQPTPDQLQSNSTTSKVKESKVKESKVKEEPHKKRKFLDFVLLTDQEFKKLVKRLGEKSASDYIERLNNGIGSKGYKYKSHYHTILSWSNKDNVGTKNAKGQSQRTEHERDFSNQKSQYGETIEV